jgi:glycosyltransferase involved in cell wall biosynthesis
LKLRAVIRKLNPEIVISFIGPINLITILACLGLRSVIVSERTNPKRADIAWTTKLLIGLTYPMAKTVVAQTNQVISSLPALSRKKAIAIPNPLAEEIQNCQASIDYENKTIVAVGRLERVKGFDLLLDAFSEIHKDFSDWRLNIWGAGSQEPAIQSQIKSLQLESVVRLNPPTTDLVAAYTSGSIFVLPSRSEGFPNALCEASALGLAVIASDCNFGPREIIEQNISGILVQPESSASLRDALLLLVQDVELRTTLGTNARKISSKLQVGKIAELWESIF